MVQKSALKKFVAILGPTSSGKTDLGQKLALALDTEIINFDSQQVYKDLDIGTGKIKAHELKVKHHLLDILEVNESMNAQSFVKRAEEIITELNKKNKIPILVGGTGLYLRSLLYGLDDLPQADPEIREHLNKVIADDGSESLHQKLTSIDPISAAKIHPNDSSRLVRALEVFEITGKPLSHFFSNQKQARYHAYLLALSLARDNLKSKIEGRVKAMLNDAWIDEVQKLLINYDENDFKKAIGYSEIIDLIKQKITREECEKEIIHQTYQYARRQMTWLRKEKDIHWYPAFDNELFDQVLLDIKEYFHEHQ